MRNNISFLPAKQQTTQKLFFRQLVETHTRQTLYSEHFGRTIKSVTAAMVVVVRHLHLEAAKEARRLLRPLDSLLLEDVGGGLTVG